MEHLRPEHDTAWSDCSLLELRLLQKEEELLLLFGKDSCRK